MRLNWRDLGTPRADKAHGKPVEITGFPVTVLPTAEADHFLLMAEPGCCQGCVPNNPLAVIEIVADRPLQLGNGALRLSGTWHLSSDLGRLALPATRRGGEAWLLAPRPARGQPALLPARDGDGAGDDGTAVDIHSHTGNLIPTTFNRGSFTPVAEPMRQGGLSIVCLAVVADSPIIKVIERAPSARPRSQAGRALRLQPEVVRAAASDGARAGNVDRAHRCRFARGAGDASRR